MLISAEKQIDSPYYKNLSSSGIEPLTPSGIVNSYPVIKRVVNVLRLQDRPFDYEKQFCSWLKAWVLEKKQSINLLLQKLRPDNNSILDEQAYLFRMAVEDVKSNMNVTPIKDTNLFTITICDYSPESAAQIANVVSRSYVIFDLEQQLAEAQLQYGEKHPVVLQLKDSIDKMIQNLNGKILPDTEAIGPATVKIIEQAEVPLVPVELSKTLSLLFAILLAPFLGILLAFGLEYIDHTIKTPQDITTYLNLPYLGSIPINGRRNNGLVRDLKQTNASTRFYQRLSDNLCLLMKDKNLKSLLIINSTPHEKNSTIVANLGNFISGKTGQKVIIIDANLNAMSIAKTFSISGDHGLADVLERKIHFEKATHDVSSHLTVLPAGDANLEPSLLLESSRMGDVIRIAKEKYGLVLIDYSDLMNLRDTCILSSYLDGVVLIVNEGKTKHHAIKEIVESLKEKKVNLLGAVLNNRTFPIPQIIYKRI